MSSWGVRIGEGLLVGLGASIMFFGVQKAQKAVGLMEGYSSRFEVQETINSELREQVVVQSNKLSAANTLLQQELVKINSSLDRLAAKVESTEKASGTASASDAVFWKALTSNTENQIKVPEGYKWFKPADATAIGPAMVPGEAEFKAYNINPSDWGVAAGVLPWVLDPAEVSSFEALSKAIEEQSQIKVQ